MAKLSLWSFAVAGVFASVSSSPEKFCHAEDPTCSATPSVGDSMLQKGPGLRLQETVSLPLDEVSIEMHPQAKDHNLPLCHHSIVHEVCATLNGNKNGAATSITKKMIAEYLYTNTSNSCFDHADTMQCAQLCTLVVTKLRELGTYAMPNASDLACYTAHDKTHCDVDVRPTTIAAETNLYAPATDHSGHKHGPENGTFLESLAYRSDMPPVRAPQFHRSQKAMPSRRESLIEGGDGGMHYDSNCGDVSVQIANLFRIYPALGVEIPLGGPEIEGTSLASAGTDMEVKIQQYHVTAQAWAATVLRELNDDNAAAFRSKWFGGTGDLSTAEVKARVVRTFNFIKRELQQGFHYVYPADDATDTACGGSTMAYVWGWTKPGLVYHETVGPDCESSNNGFGQRCGIDENGKYYVYLCQHWAGFPSQEQIATIIHEAAHHSGPGDKSYEKDVQMGFPQSTQLDNAANYQNFGRDVLESAWGCAQPDEVTVSGYYPNTCQAFASLCDTNTEVRSQCKASCGLCQSGPTPPPTPPPPTPVPTPAPCVDTVGPTSITSGGNALSCSQLLPHCTGQSQSVSDLIHEQCPVTCLVCEPTMASTSAPTMAPTSATTISGQSSSWHVTTGDCEVGGTCVSSPSYPSSYSSQQSCSFSQSGNLPISVEGFETESTYDKLTVNGIAYSGTTGPPHDAPSGNIAWSSDVSDNGKGWQICFQAQTPEATEEPTPDPTEAPTPEPTEEPTPDPTETTVADARFTMKGCLCKETWTATGHPVVTNYCGNPDSDTGGEWCFIVDENCEGAGWGYCQASSSSSSSSSTADRRRSYTPYVPRRRRSYTPYVPRRRRSYTPYVPRRRRS